MRKILMGVMCASLLACAAGRGPGLRFALEKPVPSERMAFADDVVAMRFAIRETRIAFDLRNRSDGPIEVDWAKAKYVSPEKIASGVTRTGEVASAVSIPPGGTISEAIAPSENVAWGNRSEQAPLFPGQAVSYDGREFALLLPLVVDGVPKDYTFRFKIHADPAARSWKPGPVPTGGGAVR